ncbi:MAG: DUF3221 domain-containing protein [Clostridia bacterium]|nr:DUF3221 domain-containing protein [Clostridia bacterium]MDD4375992.1 DUF3221 domain-containing protein [Clostridia bacterium]
MKLQIIGIIVMPEEDEDERRSSDKFVINTNKTYKTGERLIITYTGEIMESYPAQIRVKNIKKI